MITLADRYRGCLLGGAVADDPHAVFADGHPPTRGGTDG